MSKENTIARLKRTIKNLEGRRGTKRKMRAARKSFQNAKSRCDDFHYQAGEIELHYQNTNYYEAA